MTLIIDIGNTNIVLALFHNTSGYPKASSMQRLYTDKLKTDDEYAVIMKSLLEHIDVDPTQINFCLISSVVPKLTPIILRTANKLFSADTMVISPEVYYKLPITIPSTAIHQIGTDILANAIAAYTKYNNACIAVDFGTALTFVGVDKNENILGVSIAPGIQTAINSLFTNTAQLPSVPIQIPKSVMGVETIGAIQSGVLIGYQGLVKEILNNMKELLGNDCKCIATGGLSSNFSTHNDFFHDIDIELTVTGLAIICDYLKNKSI